MAYCPSCTSEVLASDPRCGRCGADFTANGGWKPLDVRPEKELQRRKDWLWALAAALLIGAPLSTWILLNLGGLVRSSSSGIVLILTPSALLLAHDVIGGTPGIIVYFILQFLSWWLGVFILIKVWNVVGELR